jgi:hypothetical protein
MQDVSLVERADIKTESFLKKAKLGGSSNLCRMLAMLSVRVRIKVFSDLEICIGELPWEFPYQVQPRIAGLPTGWGQEPRGHSSGGF